MIESASTHCSIIDGQPTSYSPAHRMIRALFGCVAVGLTYEDEVRMHPPDEVTSDDRSADLVMGREGQYQLLGRGRVYGQAGCPTTIKTPEAG